MTTEHGFFRPFSFGLLFLGLISPASVKASEWPQFRGPGGSASAEEQTLPDEFGPQKNLRWKIPVPPGHSSPCIWDDRVILTGSEGSRVMVMSFHRSDGSLQWKREFEMRGEEDLQHDHCSPAAPTACTNGSLIHAYFGAYGLVTLDLEGNVLWEKEFPIESNMFGTGTSPVLEGDSVYLLRDVAGVSALHCFDSETGEERWSTPRPNARTGYATPFVWKREDRTEVVVGGTSTVTGYDAANGEALWWVTGLTALVCTTPAVHGEVLYFGGWSTPNVSPANRLATGFHESPDLTEEILGDVAKFVAHVDRNGDGVVQFEEIPPGRAKEAFSALDFNKSGNWEPEEIGGFVNMPTAPGKNLLVAIQGGGEGDVTSSHVLWQKRRGLPYVASPLCYKGRVYYVKKGGFVSCVDAESGDAYYEARRLGVVGEYYSSPVGAGNRVYVGAVDGTMFVLGTGEELEVIAENKFDEGIYATPAVVDNTMYLRTSDHLWAIGHTES